MQADSLNTGDTFMVGGEDVTVLECSVLRLPNGEKSGRVYVRVEFPNGYRQIVYMDADRELECAM
jgi:hypothetical protein